MFTFRTSITCAVLVFILALAAALLIAIQVRSLHSATREAASAYMDAATTKVIGRLQEEVTAVASMVRVLATSSSVSDSQEVTETSAALPLFKSALLELPQMDSIYGGFESGAWLDVRLLSELNDRERLRATMASADVAIDLVRPTESRELPMRRIFLKTGRVTRSDGSIYGNMVTIHASGFGIGMRWQPTGCSPRRPIHRSLSTCQLSPSAHRCEVKRAASLPPISSFDNFSNFVEAQRPGEHGIVLIFDSTGSLITYPGYALLK
jgi:adenylate cyclase